MEHAPGYLTASSFGTHLTLIPAPRQHDGTAKREIQDIRFRNRRNSGTPIRADDVEIGDVDGAVAGGIGRGKGAFASGAASTPGSGTASRTHPKAAVPRGDRTSDAGYRGPSSKSSLAATANQPLRQSCLRRSSLK